MSLLDDLKDYYKTELDIDSARNLREIREHMDMQSMDEGDLEQRVDSLEKQVQTLVAEIERLKGGSASANASAGPSTFPCPYCSRMLSFTAGLAGQMCNCPSCKQQFCHPTY